MLLHVVTVQLCFAFGGRPCTDDPNHIIGAFRPDDEHEATPTRTSSSRISAADIGVSRSILAHEARAANDAQERAGAVFLEVFRTENVAVAPRLRGRDRAPVPLRA
jgi:hypothetical protein